LPGQNRKGDAKVPDLLNLDLEEVRARIHAKFNVSVADSQLAVRYLRCFLDTRRNYHSDLIILPQIADWAWHELILDTRRYNEICYKYLGRLLHHVIKPVPQDECTFERSLVFLQTTYNLPLGDRPKEWQEAGWSNPQYRLRVGIEMPARNDFSDPVTLDQIEFLSWLPTRIARRFGIPLPAALRAVNEYACQFSNVSSSGQKDDMMRLSTLGNIAWEEHVLWTRRYQTDCDKFLGFFLDHSPRLLEERGRQSQVCEFA
jgi:hypothetical protein